MRQRHVGDFDGHMDVVGHPAIGVVAVAEALDAVAQEPLEGPAITLGQEDRLAVVTASDEVIEGSAVVLSRFPSHTLEDAKRAPELASCRPGTHGRELEDRRIQRRIVESLEVAGTLAAVVCFLQLIRYFS